MTTISRIRTDYDARLHVEVDTDATVDCFFVTLPPYTYGPGVLVYREGADMNALWAEALAVVARLRAHPWKEIHPPHVFQPFGVITARNREDVRREFDIRMNLMGAGMFHTDARWRASVERDPVLHIGAHDRRVAELCRALDLMDGTPLTVAVPWPNFKALN